MRKRARVSGSERLDTRFSGPFDRNGRLCYDALMAGTKRSTKRRSARAASGGAGRAKLLKQKGLKKKAAARKPPINLVDPEVQQQYKNYEEALRQFHQQKFHKAKELLEKVIAAPSKELADRARAHLSICEQRISRQPSSSLRTPEEYYQHGVAMMNHGRWDEAREHLARARKLAPKSDYIVYAMAALDCLTGEAESAMENLKLAIELKPENRYHARNDEDFAFLQEDPRFTELLYPEREGMGG
jgi:Flp pilus assembly protein TadD